MAPVHGSKGVLKVQNAAGVLTDITQYVNSVTFNQDQDAAETTAFGAGNKTYIPGIPDAGLSVEANYDDALAALLDGIIGMTRTFEWNPAGTATGTRKYSGSGFLTGYEDSGDVSDKTGISFSIQPSSSITRGANP